jgi:hypothetical protein
VPSSEIVTVGVDKIQEDGKATTSPKMHEGDKKYVKRY